MQATYRLHRSTHHVFTNTPSASCLAGAMNRTRVSSMTPLERALQRAMFTTWQTRGGAASSGRHRDSDQQADQMHAVTCCREKSFSEIIFRTRTSSALTLGHTLSVRGSSPPGFPATVLYMVTPTSAGETERRAQGTLGPRRLQESSLRFEDFLGKIGGHGCWPQLPQPL